jgi:hypothetical protein
MNPQAASDRWDYDRIAGSVSGDLAKLFGDDAPGAPPEPLAPVPAPPVRQGGDGVARIGVIVAAGFIGIAAGLALSRGYELWTAQPSPAAALPSVSGAG